MIVYGVAEVRSAGTSAAAHIQPVGAVDETTFRAIRQVADTLIYPPVTGMQLLRLSPAGHPDDGVLVLLVPDSESTVDPDGRFMANHQVPHSPEPEGAYV